MTIRRLDFRLGALAFAALCTLCMPAPAQELGMPAPDVPRGRLQKFSDRASELVMRAMGLIGIRYKYGGGAPEHGLDCSGLVRYVFQEAWGLSLPRTSEEISRVGERIESDELQPGDLVFYNTLRRSFSHVGIYVGDNKFLHAPAAGGRVRIESMDVGYWKKRFNGARRINDPQQKPQLPFDGPAQAPLQSAAPPSPPVLPFTAIPVGP